MCYDYFDFICSKEPPRSSMLAIAPAKAGRVRHNELGRATQRVEPIKYGRRGVEFSILDDCISYKANHSARWDSEPAMKLSSFVSLLIPVLV